MENNLYFSHYIITDEHVYELINWEEIEEWNKLPFYKKWFIKKPQKKLKQIKTNEE